MAGGESEIIDNWLVINSIDNGYLSIDNGYLLVDNGHGRNTNISTSGTLPLLSNAADTKAVKDTA